MGEHSILSFDLLGGGRYGQDRRGGANRFGGEKRFDDNR